MLDSDARRLLMIRRRRSLPDILMMIHAAHALDVMIGIEALRKGRPVPSEREKNALRRLGEVIDDAAYASKFFEKEEISCEQNFNGRRFSRGVSFSCEFTDACWEKFVALMGKEEETHSARYAKISEALHCVCNDDTTTSDAMEALELVYSYCEKVYRDGLTNDRYR